MKTTSMARSLWQYFADRDYRDANALGIFTALPVTSPVLRLDRFWVISGHEAVRQLAVRPELRMAPPAFPKSVRHRNPGFVEFFSNSLSFADEFDHSRLRGVLMPQLTPAALRGMAAVIRGLVDELLTGAANRARDAGAPAGIDFVRDVATPLPIMVTGYLLGVPTGDRSWLADRVRGLLSVLQGSFPGTGDCHGAPISEAEFVEVRDYALDLLTSRGRRGALGTAVGDALAAGALEPDEAVRLVLLLFMTGVDTVTTALTNTVHALLDRPEEFHRLRAGGRTTEELFAEAVRLYTPSPFASRSVIGELEVNGVTMRRGDAVLLCYAGANRDPVRFPDPTGWRPERRPAGSLGFGYGTYHCVGSALAGVQASATLDALADLGVQRDPTAGPLRWREELSFRSPAELRIRIGTAPARTLA